MLTIEKSISVYPPLILNYKLKSSDGLSVDFLYLNNIGYIALVTSMSLLLYNEQVRQLYFRYHNYYPLLTNIDLIYSSHGLLMNIVTISQLYFWGFAKRSTHIRKTTKLIITGVMKTMIILSYLCVGTGVDKPYIIPFTLLDLAIILSYVKIFMSIIKYIPQLSHNYKRKSVVGFSILTIFLDLTGGILSILQLFIDSYIMTGSLKFDILINNSGKLGLSFVTLFFDGCFIYQWLIYEKNCYKSLKLPLDIYTKSEEALA